MKSKGGRYIPIGYSAADIASIRPMFQDYLVCGSMNSTIDFFAVNIYEWVWILIPCLSRSFLISQSLLASPLALPLPELSSKSIGNVLI
jgi:hypothetical protein